jgi:hypothetical protein
MQGIIKPQLSPILRNLASLEASAITASLVAKGVEARIGYPYQSLLRGF